MRVGSWVAGSDGDGPRTSSGGSGDELRTSSGGSVDDGGAGGAGGMDGRTTVSFACTSKDTRLSLAGTRRRPESEEAVEAVEEAGDAWTDKEAKRMSASGELATKVGDVVAEAKGAAAVGGTGAGKTAAAVGVVAREDEAEERGVKVGDAMATSTNRPTCSAMPRMWVALRYSALATRYVAWAASS